jgi:hypothetical protein
MRRGLLLLLSAFALAVALAPLAVANNGNKPDRRVNLDQGDGTIVGACAFPVFAHIDGREIDTAFSIQDRTVVRLLGIFPGNSWTLTNLESGTTMTVRSTSSFHELFQPDGTFSIKVVGEGVWPFENPITHEPGIWHQKGQVSGLFDADGNPISTKNTGSLVNICPQLA